MLCAIYCRLSKEDEDKRQLESESIQNQKSMLVKYAKDRGWDIYKLYCDEDFSGADASRPAFTRLLRDAQRQCFQVLLCKTQSRFTRDMELVERYLHSKFPLWGIRFVTIADHVDTDIKGNKKTRQINGLINEWYLEDLSENIRMVFDHKRKQGQYIGGFPIYGYQKDPVDKNRLIIDPEAAAVVRQIYAWYLEGRGKQQIAGLLNDRSWPNPTRYKQEKGWRYHNGSASEGLGLWSKTTVGRILRNEMYTGVMIQGRRKKVSYKSSVLVDMPAEDWFRVEGTHEAIVSPEVFQSVQALLRPRVKTDGRGEVHPLSGLVRCMDCGSTMTKTTTDGRSYLRCKQSHGGRACCTRHSVRLERLLAAVVARLRTHIATDYACKDLGRFAATAQMERQVMLLEREGQQIQIQIEKRTAALKALYLDKTAGMIDEEQFRVMNRDFLEEKARMACRRRALQAEIVHRQEGRDEAALKTWLAQLLMLETAPRQLLVAAIERIEVGERNPETGRQAIHIQWRF